MSDLPELSSREIQEEIKRLYAKPRKQHLHAVFGRGLEERLRVDGAGEFQVVPVRSELELRERMPALEAEEPRLVFLVPWQGSVPLDLSSRFASSRVNLVGLDRRLQTLCGVQSAANLGHTPLAKYLLRPTNPKKLYPVSSGTLTEEALWTAWLATDWNLHFNGGIARDILLAWAGTDPRGPQFLMAMAEKSAEGVRDAWLAYLSRAVPGVGPIAWRAWEQGRGAELLHVAAFCECLAANQDGAVSMWLSERLKPLVEASQLNQLSEVARLLGETAPLAFRWLGSRHTDQDLDALFAAADARVDASVVRAALSASDRLPSAWRLRLDRLGALLSQGAVAPTLDAVTEAAGALKQLETHRSFQREGETLVVKRAEMAVKLLAWLAAPREIAEAGNDHADAIETARWYAKEGGFVDWARRWARGEKDSPLGQGAQAVVERADRERAELDRRFTRSLEHWIAAGRPSNRMVPIDQALKRFGVTFLEQDEQRRLLVLLMDGMAWAQAAELLQSLGTRAHGWGPIAWYGMQRGSEGPYPAVLANLPTTTEVSRAAFFAGKEMPNGSTLNTQKDDERFKNNKALHPFCDETLGPRLLLRAEGHNQDGSASNEALEVIRDVRRGVVGVVVNAIDASLKGDTQQAHEWTADSIRSLPALLDAARQAGRTVLLAADHGHVPADRPMRSLGAPAQAGARWRPWLGAADVLQPGELKLSGSGVYSPKGTEGVVVVATEDARYGAGAHAGEHGGATLAEVVTPCFLIGWDETGPGADPALKPRAAFTPDWWYYALRPAQASPTTPTPPGVKKKKGVSEAQLGLPLPGEKVALPPPVIAPRAEAEELPPTVVAFSSCEMLKARAASAEDRKLVTRAVALLLVRGGALAAEVFAQHLDYPPYRVEGLIRRFQEVLNVDGYAVLRFDSGTRQIFLDKSKLEQQFEVKL